MSTPVRTSQRRIASVMFNRFFLKHSKRRSRLLVPAVFFFAAFLALRSVFHPRTDAQPHHTLRGLSVPLAQQPHDGQRAPPPASRASRREKRPSVHAALPDVHGAEHDSAHRDAALDSALHDAAPPNASLASRALALRIVLLATHATSVLNVQDSVASISRSAPHATVHLVHFSPTPDQTLLDLVHTHSTIASRRPYDNPLLAVPESAAAHDANADNMQTLLLRAGALLSPHAIPWLRAAHSAYAARPDLAAIALDAVEPSVRVSRTDPDHSASAWAPVRLPGASQASVVLHRLLPSADAVLVNPNRSLKVWSVFQEWLTLRRADWYRYPRGPGVDGTPLGRAAQPDSNWTRAPWHVWFSKFVHDYRLTVAFPRAEGGKLVARDAAELLGGALPDWAFPETLPVYLGDGRKAAGSYFGDDTIARIEALARENQNTVSLTMVNKVFLDTARSWLCNVDVGGFRPAGLVWAVTDEESRDALSQVAGSSTVWLARATGGKKTGNEFGNPGYWKLMLERTMLITEILARGVGVFAFETDAIWLADPQPDIEALVGEEADMVGTINTRSEVSGNFFYLRPTLATRRLWHEITDEFGKAYRAERFERKKATSWTYIQNDQSLLTGLVLRNETWRASHPLSFLTLDMEKFVDGRWYTPKEGFYTSERARKPVVINNNFVIGIKEKTERAKKFGHWFWDEGRKTCLDSVVKKVVTARTTE